ncbi:MAG: hypothetical protein IKS18_04905 [Lachnospiraceae bacterium]|nr:hypothetical protein [Lachnospiraceae bacterium]
MKRILLLLLAMTVMMLMTSCGKGNAVFRNMTLEGSALSFFDMEDGTSYRNRTTFDADKEGEFLKALSSTKATPVENWSFQDMTYPVYGFYLIDSDRFMQQFAWSNGILFTEDGKKYKFDFDFAAVTADYPFKSTATLTNLAGFPCARQFMQLGDSWNTKFMSIGQEPENRYDVAYEIVSLDQKYLTVRFTNHMDDAYTYGEYYALQVLVGDSWYEVPPFMSVTVHDLAYVLSPEQSRELSYWIEPYGELPAGHYRVLNGLGALEYDFAAEFDLPLE